jgi:hypothetical protein
MHTATNEAATLFQKLGDAETLMARSGERLVSLPRPRVNAHIHLPPNFSAFESVAEAVDLAAAQDVRVLGVSNYYDYSVYNEFAARSRAKGIFPLFGIEIIALLEELLQAGVKINDPGNPGKMYICGKGITQFAPMTAEAAELLEVIRRKDSARMARMTERLTELFAAAGLDTGLDEESVKARIVRRHGSPIETVYLQERHVAQAFQEVLFEQIAVSSRSPMLERLFGVPSKAALSPEKGVGYRVSGVVDLTSGSSLEREEEAEWDAVGVQNEIRSHLMKAGKPAYVEETFVGFDHAYRLILALGGIPCYPTLADGANPVCPYEAPVERLIAETKARGILCAEFIPLRNSPETLTHYVRAMRAAGLVVTAGTEHNTLDVLPIEPACVQGLPIPEELREIFWEGACVVAAHQYRKFRGEPGFVDERGRPNAAYDTDEARIAEFRNLGAAVIRQYQEVISGETNAAGVEVASG